MSRAATGGDWTPSEPTLAAFAALLGSDAATASNSIEDVTRSQTATSAVDAALDRCLWPETGAALEESAAACADDDGTFRLLWRVHQVYQTGGRRALMMMARRERRAGLAAYMDRARRRCWCAASDWWGGVDEYEEEPEQAEEEAAPEWVVVVATKK